MPQTNGPIIVTGACGFVGQWLMRLLADAAPYRQIVSTSSRAGEADETLDVTDAVAVERVVARLRPSAVVNLAALSFVPEAEDDPHHAYRVNLFGPMHLAQTILREVPICRLLFVGSSEVYGASFLDRSGPLNEDAPLEPMNVYAASKAAADLLMGQFARRGLQVVRFRPFNHFGPGQSPRFVIASFAQQIVAAEETGKAVIRVGNLDSERDFLDVRDVVAAYTLAVTRPEPLPPGTVLNIASGVPRRIGSILEGLTALSPAVIKFEPAADRYRASDVRRAVGDSSRARAMLGWSPTYCFDDTLREVLEDVRRRQSSSTRI